MNHYIGKYFIILSGENTDEFNYMVFRCISFREEDMKIIIVVDQFEHDYSRCNGFYFDKFKFKFFDTEEEAMEFKHKIEILT